MLFISKHYAEGRDVFRTTSFIFNFRNNEWRFQSRLTFYLELLCRKEKRQTAGGARSTFIRPIFAVLGEEVNEDVDALHE